MSSTASGAIDFTHPEAEAGYDTPAVGHGGMGSSRVARLVAFPETGVVIAVQANADTFAQTHDVVTSLAAAALT